MPVTCTSVPRVLRVSYIAFEDDFVRREVVCFIQPTGQGPIDIMYSHHVDYSRPTVKGSWDSRNAFKLPLSKSVIAEISSHVLHEFWHEFGFKVRDMPYDRTKPIPVPDNLLEGGVQFG